LKTPLPFPPPFAGSCLPLPLPSPRQRYIAAVPA